MLTIHHPNPTPNSIDRQAGAKLYVTAIACLSYGLSQYNEMVRCTVASAGNDHRLGAQEAPPAIISLYPGQGFEQFMESIVSWFLFWDFWKW